MNSAAQGASTERWAEGVLHTARLLSEGRVPFDGRTISLVLADLQAARNMNPNADEVKALLRALSKFQRDYVTGLRRCDIQRERGAEPTACFHCDREVTTTAYFAIMVRDTRHSKWREEHVTETFGERCALLVMKDPIGSLGARV